MCMIMGVAYGGGALAIGNHMATFGRGGLTSQSTGLVDAERVACASPSSNLWQGCPEPTNSPEGELTQLTQLTELTRFTKKNGI